MHLKSSVDGLPPSLNPSPFFSSTPLPLPNIPLFTFSTNLLLLLDAVDKNDRYVLPDENELTVDLGLILAIWAEDTAARGGVQGGLNVYASSSIALGGSGERCVKEQ
jgi:hypothetical protein